MKRIGYLYEKIYDLENIKLAIKNATRRKKKRKYVQAILADPDYYAREIQQLLMDRAFKSGQNKVKTIKDGYSQKERVITIPQFYPDQIIHWATMQVLQPVLYRGMIAQCCGSVKGRGGLAAKRYVEKVQDKPKARYVLKLDIRHFFPSVNHDKLKELLARKIKDKDTLALLSEIIDGGGEGLPIGYYSSQLLSNFYLEEIDHFMKQTLGIRYYVRYVDDIVCWDSNRRKLKKAVEQLAEFMRTNGYGLEIKPDWQIWESGTRPIDFVGYRFRKGRKTRLRKRLFYHLTRTLKRVKKFGLNIQRARRVLSLMGWTKRINFKTFYEQNVKPVISKAMACAYVSRYERRAESE